MRMGEVAALKWGSINFDDNTITVCESYKRIKKYEVNGSSINLLEKKSPKTEKGNRVIPIPKPLSSDF